jgi:uncharacterized protein YjbI with pentapeptide repeats
MADDGSQQRKPDFRMAVKDVKALATVLAMEAESILGRRTARVLGALALFAAVVAILVSNGTGFANKTLFQWLDVLIVPSVLAASVFLLEQSQRRREQAVEERREEDLRLDSTLQAFLDGMAELLVQERLANVTNAYDQKRVLARSLTLSALSQLDPYRKASAVRFLYESRLIQRAAVIEGTEVSGGIVSLAGADLRGVFLRAVFLRGADLSGADLSNADLSEASLSDTDLGGAFLRSAYLAAADLTSVSLVNADLTGADLTGADLTGADLTGADLTGADLTGADFSGAIVDQRQLVETGNGDKDTQIPRHLRRPTHWGD